MKSARLLAALLLLLIVALVGWYGLRSMRSFRPEDRNQPGGPPGALPPPPPAHSAYDPGTHLWLEYPLDGLVIPGSEDPSPEPPALISPRVAGLLWRVYAGPLGRTSPPQVTVWRLNGPVPSGGLEAVGQQLLDAIRQRYDKVTPLAAVSFNDAGLGGKRVNYSLTAIDPAGGPLMVRFALLALDDRGYLAWSTGPLEARRTLDRIVSSLRFRRKGT